MPNDWFQFRCFRIRQDRTAMKVGTDGVLLGAWAGDGTAGRILDIGTGTGLLALMLAQRNPEADITAIELDRESALQASENASESPWSSRVHVVEADFLEWNPEPDDRYDLIVCNPPYFTRSLKNPVVARAGARHDDNLPLQGLIRKAASLLTGSGKLSLILPSERVPEAAVSASENRLFLSRELKVKGHAHAPVKRILVEWSPLPAMPVSGELILETAVRGRLTDEYRLLTEAFYLPRTADQL